ncbi:MAG: type II toxin-antitoxin system VapC family toxin [Vulcanimicrobiaceae bacterium]
MVDLLAGNDAAAVGRARDIVLHAARRGPLVVTPIVHAELMAHPGATEAGVAAFLADLAIAVQWSLSETSWRRAAAAFGAYAHRRRSAGGRSPRRLVADFVIGAHAVEAGAFATRDAEFLRRVFPGLHVIG